MSNMIPPAIADLVGRVKQIGDELESASGDINTLKTEISTDAIVRNTGFVGAISVLENLEKAQALLLSWTFGDRRHVQAADAAYSNVFWAAEKVREFAMEFAQHYANLEKRVAAAEVVAHSIQSRVREHATSNPSVREEVFNSTGGLCFYCEAQLLDASYGPVEGADQERIYHVDHIVPKAHGGPDHLTNYVPACAKCNTAKTDRPFAQFVKRRNVKLRVVNGWPKEGEDDAANF